MERKDSPTDAGRVRTQNPQTELHEVAFLLGELTEKLMNIWFMYGHLIKDYFMFILLFTKLSY